MQDYWLKAGYVMTFNNNRPEAGKIYRISEVDNEEYMLFQRNLEAAPYSELMMEMPAVGERMTRNGKYWRKKVIEEVLKGFHRGLL